MQQDVLELFSPATAEWFTNTFGEPTDVQKAAWPAIAAGKPALVSAPTGTGKTLSAFPDFYRPVKRPGQGEEAEGGTVSDLYFPPQIPGRGYPGEPAAAAPGWDRRGQEGQEEIQVANPHRGHASEGPAEDGQASASHPDHHPGIPVSHADLQNMDRSVLKTARALIIGRAPRPHRHQTGSASDALRGQA